jgi:hypothetical protein
VSEETIRDDVAAICDFDGRLPGTDAERRASKHVATRLDSTGRRATVESTYVQPQWAVVHFLHCAVAAIGSMIAAKEPAIGFAMVLVAATSAYLDLNARHYLLRRLPFRRASQNVHSLPAADATPTVILCANVDAPRTGAGYNRLPSRLQELAARSGLPVVSAPTRLWFWSIALLLPPLGARMAGFEPNWLAAVQLPQTLLLIVACFLLGEIALSPASPGANTNASGIAALLDALRRLDADPPANLRVEAVVCGAGETSMQGMRAFVRAHRGDLDRSSTWFVSLESVGRGEPRWVVSQGPAVSLPMDKELAELCAALVEAGEGRAEPMRDGRTSAAYVARAYKLRALPITCREPGRALPEDFHTPRDTPEAVDPAAIAAAASLATDLIRLLDRDVGRRATKPALATEPAPAAAG